MDIFNGIKLAAGGELGIGVGEEEWGSGEREVLEDFVSRTEGLEDLVVSRFGDPPIQPASSKEAGKAENSAKEDQSWIGSDSCPRPSDGVIFSGVGSVARPSLTQVSLWMEWIYRYGEDTYGVRDDPHSNRRRKRRKERSSRMSRDALQVPKREARQQTSLSPGQTPTGSPPPGIPPPLVTAVEQQPQPSSSKPESCDSSQSTRQPSPTGEEKPADSSAFGTENFMKYLTLGYGSAWGNSTKMAPAHPRVSILRQTDKTSGDDSGGSDAKSTTTESTPETSAGEQEDILQRREETIGRFIIGLRDDLEDEDTDDEEFEDKEPEQKSTSTIELNRKILRRTLDIRPSDPIPSGDDQGTDNTFWILYYLPIFSNHPMFSGTPQRSRSTKLQVVIYLVSNLPRDLLTLSPSTNIDLASTIHVRISPQTRNSFSLPAFVLPQYPSSTWPSPETPALIHIPCQCRTTNIRCRGLSRQQKEWLIPTPTTLRHHLQPINSYRPLFPP